VHAQRCIKKGQKPYQWAADANVNLCSCNVPDTDAIMGRLYLLNTRNGRVVRVSRTNGRRIPDCFEALPSSNAARGPVAVLEIHLELRH